MHWFHFSQQSLLYFHLLMALKNRKLNFYNMDKLTRDANTELS